MPGEYAGSPSPTPAFTSPSPSRPMSAIVRAAPRSSSRMSMGSRAGGSRASDEDGRTSVKVAVRVRPPLNPNDPGYDLIPQRFQKSMVHVSSPTSIAVDSPQGRKIFVFDRVFDEDTTQEGIWGYLEESVNAFIQGFNVSVLAYGQSGAGKSYTMGTAGYQGEDPQHMGVIPRAAAALFERLGNGSAGGQGNRNSGIRAPVRYSTSFTTLQKQNPDKGWTMKASYVEIYNEQLRDLLLPEGTRNEDRAPITIREDTKGRIILTGLRQVEVNSVDDLLGVLQFGSSIRQTDATAINAKSSRSHAVFSLNLVQRKNGGAGDKAVKRMSMPVDMNQDGFMTVDSKMHFVDLAGSERLKNTHAQGDRAKEGIAINAGLASLGKVISQLSSRSSGSHVSYRDSKLTRLLQDSLGGNAITYMVACVTPAEFHLSETLNTVQYAQRARAIQSKPRIQQVNDDGDLKQLVERLRAEITFLREQVSHSKSETNAAQDGSTNKNGRSAEKEIELQNQLLDLQENYNALSQRHAKLISDMTRARDEQAANTANATSEYAESAVERINRSNSFAEAVEQVVLEYETTIQSLEATLSSTRGSLSSTETMLLEKESKLAYAETVNQQLQARLQKMMDRESSTESYLQDLESKLQGHSSGEEKSAAIVSELKKEIARLRENESGAEDYISTLEERLAEAEQDMELMKREIDRLEHVVERQRSLGRLDNLLLELDSAKTQKNGAEDEVEEKQNGEGAPKRPRVLSLAGSNKGDDSDRNTPSFKKRAPTPVDLSATPSIKEEDDNIQEQFARIPENATLDYPPPSPAPPSPAQSQFVEDRLESVQQELVDLQVKHETTLNEYDQLSANYESVLRNLAALQDQLDEAKHEAKQAKKLAEIAARGVSPESPFQRPTSFLAESTTSDAKESEDQPPSSRSLSSELSMAGESTVGTELTETYGDSPTKEELEAQRLAAQEREEALQRELEKLKKEKARIQRIHEEEQEELHLQLRIHMDQLEELKNNGSADRNTHSTSPSQLLRRKSSQSLAVLDRAQRAFNNLRRIATEHFPNDPDILENFELNLDGAMRELQNRSERIQELEQEIHNIRREMDAKQQMIAGLTRERTSIQTSPMDISVVAVLERRIAESEGELHKTRNELALRMDELNSAKNALNAASSESQSDAVALLEELTKERELNAEQAKQINELQAELKSMKDDQEHVLGTLQKSKENLEKTLSELEGQLARTKEDAVKQEHEMRENSRREIRSYQERIDALQETISENKRTIAVHMDRVADLEKAHLQLRANMEASRASSPDEELRSQREAVEELEKTIAQNKDTIEAQQSRLAALEASYDEAVEELEALRQKETAAAAALEEAQRKAEEEAAAAAEAREKLVAVEAELEGTKNQLASNVEKVAELQASLKNTLKGKIDSEGEASNVDTSALEAEIAERNATIEEQLKLLEDLEATHAQTQEQLKKVSEKEAGHAKLLEDLEQQLTFTFDESQETQRKLKTLTADYEKLQSEHTDLASLSAQKYAEAQSTIHTLQSEITALKSRISELELELSALPESRATRSNSSSSRDKQAARQSGSTGSLPSPPPAIPLPPLPSAASPPPGASRRPSKDYQTHLEEQEARIRSLEKHLYAEKELTKTLEEALADCEKTMKRLTSDRDSFQARASQVQQELERQKKESESQSSRYSMQAVEEERLARQKAEQAREQLELRMQALAKKKGRSFACF